MITISTVDFSIDGWVQVRPDGGSNLGDFKRRNSRAATLDGGAAVTDHGYSDGDRTFSIGCYPSKDEARRLADMVRFHPQVQVSTAEGFYLCQMDFTPTNKKANLTLRVIERLDED